jgi:hypothetical protein
VSRGLPFAAACCRLAMRSIECMHFYSVPAHLHYKDFLAGCLPGSPLGFSFGYPMLFLRFYSLPGGKVHEPRFAACCRLAMRSSIECMHFDSVPAHPHHKDFLAGCLPGSLPGIYIYTPIYIYPIIPQIRFQA